MFSSSSPPVCFLVGLDCCCCLTKPAASSRSCEITVGEASVEAKKKKRINQNENHCKCSTTCQRAASWSRCTSLPVFNIHRSLCHTSSFLSRWFERLATCLNNAWAFIPLSFFPFIPQPALANETAHFHEKCEEEACSIRQHQARLEVKGRPFVAEVGRRMRPRASVLRSSRHMTLARKGGGVPGRHVTRSLWCRIGRKKQLEPRGTGGRGGGVVVLDPRDICHQGGELLVRGPRESR